MSTEANNPGTGTPERNQRKVVRGIVTSNKMQKTVVVQVDRKVRHPLYEKFVSRRTKLYAHDEQGEAKIGDVVEIAQTRPLSKLKRWRLVRVVQKAPQA
ncbi:MAG: 30S ribosomal protein S17 [Planctomycetes bacterium]|nr:30S ribosomal protein S17 [Planctomycetota bacterium]MBZ0151052.1 30S ribosomal protein S17 [Planctomycetota bacterium]MCC7399177.1 30S ribosomal protein S17 [Planctomycetota bacterium]